MRKILMLLLFVNFSVAAEDVAIQWEQLSSKYLVSIQQQNYNKALELALELHNIDPSDTQVLLYIVFSSVKSQSEIPNWVMSEPWPAATNRDKFNRLLAEYLLNGS